MLRSLQKGGCLPGLHLSFGLFWNDDTESYLATVGVPFCHCVSVTVGLTSDDPECREFSAGAGCEAFGALLVAPQLGQDVSIALASVKAGVSTSWPRPRCHPRLAPALRGQHGKSRQLRA